MKKLFPIIVLFLAVSVFAQEEPKAILVDEFGSITCEDFLARVDNFTYRLNQERTATGLVLLRGRNNSFKKMLITSFNVRLGKEIEASVVENTESLKGGEFWLVPQGSSPPLISDGRVVAVYPQTYDAINLFSHEGEGPCSFNTLPAFLQLLRSKLELRGKIVIFGPARERPESVAFLINQLPKADRRRIKVLYRTKIVPYTEFWIIPTKKK